MEEKFFAVSRRMVEHMTEKSIAEHGNEDNESRMPHQHPVTFCYPGFNWHAILYTPKRQVECQGRGCKEMADLGPSNWKRDAPVFRSDDRVSRKFGIFLPVCSKQSCRDDCLRVISKYIERMYFERLAKNQ